MAGRQRGRAIRESLEAKGGIDWLADQVLRGRSMRSLACEIGCGRWWLDRWVHGTNERRSRVARARACGAVGARSGSAVTTAVSCALGGSQQPADGAVVSNPHPVPCHAKHKLAKKIESCPSSRFSTPG